MVIGANEGSKKGARDEASVRFRRLFEAARDGILLVDPNSGRIVDANPFILEFLAYTRAELLGKQLYEIGLFEDESANRAGFVELQQKHYIRYDDRPLKTKTGVTRSVEFVSNVYDEGDHQIIQCNIRDNEERHRAQEILKDRSVELERIVQERTSDLISANEQLQAFTSSVAHDLRQQVRSVNVRAAMLVEDMGEDLGAEFREQIQSLSVAAKSLARLTDDVVTFAKVGRQHPHREDVDMSAIAAEIVTSLKETRQCEPGAHFSIQPDLRANADPSLIRIVMENLLGNACKYSAARPAPEITFFEDSRGFVVRDNGIGFDMKYVDKLFQPFERLAGTAYPGTGIGLASVKRIVERHGGTVSAEGKLGEGAAFYFKLL